MHFEQPLWRILCQDSLKTPNRILIDKLSEFADKAVTIRGWVYNKRSSGKINFVLVRDGFGIAQCVVVKNQVKPEVFADYDLLTQESSLIVTGKVHKDDRAPGGYDSRWRI